MDYRAKYAEYYQIEIGKDMDVHHIDGDRTNNNIDNLLLLPKDIHQRMHKSNFYVEAMEESARKIARRAYRLACCYGAHSYEMKIWEECSEVFYLLSIWGFLKSVGYVKPSGEKLNYVDKDASWIVAPIE